MSTHNIGFYEDLTKLSFNYHPISPNTHLISSSLSEAIYILTRDTCIDEVRFVDIVRLSSVNYFVYKMLKHV